MSEDHFEEKPTIRRRKTLAKLDTRHVKQREREGPLRRLFSSFPGGEPGIGLLLLRAAIGGSASAMGVLYLSGLSPRDPLLWTVVASTLILSGVALVIGFMAPLASLFVGFCASGIVLSRVPTPPFSVVGARLIALIIVIVAIGIALLGPGAYSVDGYLFGRREIVIKPRLPEP
jgi:uncharacterized membrane protein YphA (DoxX/SURF4 family)